MRSRHLAAIVDVHLLWCCASFWEQRRRNRRHVSHTRRSLCRSRVLMQRINISGISRVPGLLQGALVSPIKQAPQHLPLTTAGSVEACML